MYLFKTSIKGSEIEGNGVFAAEEIPNGGVVWKFDPAHDQTLSPNEYEQLDEAGKAEIRKVGYISSTSGKWVFPPEGDPARFTNHSDTANNLTAVFDKMQSSEPFFVANRDIHAGDELLANYREFDESIKKGIPEWMKTI